MSVWTWTIAKANVIPEDTLDNLLDKTEDELNNRWNIKESQTEDGYQKVLESWIKIHQDYIDDYYVAELNMKKEDCNNEFFKKLLDEHIQRDKDKLSDIEKIRKKEMSLDEYVRKYHLCDDEDDNISNGEFISVMLGGEVYVNIPSIFRLREYSEMSFEDGISDIETLIEYLKKPERQDYITDFLSGETGLTESLEKRIREFYGKLGNGNFTVHFG